jgi:hypothetical protein
MNYAQFVAAALVSCGMLCTPLSAHAQSSPPQPQTVKVHFLKQEMPAPPTLSNLDPIPEDLGLAGARLALEENTTTGRFLGQTWELSETLIPEGGDFEAAVKAALVETDLLVLDAPAELLLKAADAPEAASALLFNISDTATELRSDACRANLLHTLPSRDMLSDALMQFVVLRRWTDLALIEGTLPGDAEMAAALRASATKFGLRIAREKTWAFDADMRRNAAQEVRSSPRTLATTTCCSLPMKPMTSPATFPTTHGCPARPPAPKASPPAPGPR